VAFQYENQLNKELKTSQQQQNALFWEGKGKGIQEIAKF
jgi:hypothetical protein